MLLCNTFILVFLSCLCGSENQVLMISAKKLLRVTCAPSEMSVVIGNVLVAPNVVKSIINLVLPLVISEQL